MAKSPFTTCPATNLQIPQIAPIAARPIDEWHEDFGDAVWWSIDPETGDWRGESAFIGSPLGSDWPGYHTHWTPHPALPPMPEVGDAPRLPVSGGADGI